MEKIFRNRKSEQVRVSGEQKVSVSEVLRGGVLGVGGCKK